MSADALINYEAEMALLGALLARNELWHRAAEIVRAEHFADALHGRIFSAIGKTLQAGSIIRRQRISPPESETASSLRGERSKNQVTWAA